MRNVKTFEIIFADGKTVYHPGEFVRGKCILELRGDVKLKSLRMFMRGEAKVHWTESRSTGTRLGAYTEHYNAEVEYFSRKQLLLGNENNSDFITLTEGRNEFNFGFDLPNEGICTSFEGKHGSIRYWLKAELIKSWLFNLKVKKAFTVITPIDINKPEFQMPVENNVEKTLCCWFCRTGLISLSARTDRKGYCPGESIAIWAEFSNQSSRTVVPYATLNQTQTFFANGKTRVRASKFSALTGAQIKGYDRATWDGQLLKIPAVSPTVNNCCVIRVEYYIKVALHIPGSYNLSMHLPIIVGTVPFRRIPFCVPSRHCRVPVFLQSSREFNPSSNDSATVAVNDVAVASLGTSTRGLYQLPAPPPYRENPSPLLDRRVHFADPPMYVETIMGGADIRDDESDFSCYDDEEDWVQARGGTNGTYFTPMYTYVQNYTYAGPPAYSEVDPFPQ